MSGTKDAEPAPKSAKTADDEDTNPLNVEDVRKVIFSLLPIKTLCRYKRISKSFRADAGQVIANRTTRVTDDDVAKNKHVAKLRQLIKEAEPGQTIELAPGRYILGDETARGHCEERIRYPGSEPSNENAGTDDEGDFFGENDSIEEAWNGPMGYFGDHQWNRWKFGFGPLTIKKAGIHLIGKATNESRVQASGESDSRSLGRASIILKAHAWISVSPIAIRILARGVCIENIDVEGYCTGVTIGCMKTDQRYIDHFYDCPPSHWSHGFKGVRSRSATIRNCNFYGTSIRVCAKSDAAITDCVIKDDNGGFDGKGSVRVSNGATARLVRTKILNSGRCAYQAHFEREEGFPNNNDCYGGLSLGDRSTTYLENVEISGCVPSGIVVSTRLAKVVLCGPVLFRNNAKGIVVEDGPSSNVRFAIDTLMHTLDYAPEEIRSELEASYNNVPNPSRKRAYPDLFKGKTSFCSLYRNPKEGETDQTLAKKNMESARIILSSNGSAEGNACLEEILSKVDRIEQGRAAIANGSGHKNDFNMKISLIHDEGMCSADCELCQFDIQLPSYIGDRRQETLDWFKERDAKQTQERESGPHLDEMATNLKNSK